MKLNWMMPSSENSVIRVESFSTRGREIVQSKAECSYESNDAMDLIRDFQALTGDLLKAFAEAHRWCSHKKPSFAILTHGEMLTNGYPMWVRGRDDPFWMTSSVGIWIISFVVDPFQMWGFLDEHPMIRGNETLEERIKKISHDQFPLLLLRKTQVAIVSVPWTINDRQ